MLDFSLYFHIFWCVTSDTFGRVNIPAPALPSRTARAEQIIATAREMTESGGWDSLTMRGLAERIGIKAPSLYKHTANKDELRAMLTVDAIEIIGNVLWETRDKNGRFHLSDLMVAFRRVATEQPQLYRLVANGTTHCETLQSDPWRTLLEDMQEWAGSPVATIADNQLIAITLWSSAHGIACMETDGRYPDTAFADTVWETLISTFEPYCGQQRSTPLPFCP
nr:TetR/AcrR family transcriptional regulator [Corynebacterium pygosceleis]